jgi:chromosome partitioning protein
MHEPTTVPDTNPGPGSDPAPLPDRADASPGHTAPPVTTVGTLADGAPPERTPDEVEVMEDIAVVEEAVVEEEVVEEEVVEEEDRDEAELAEADARSVPEPGPPSTEPARVDDSSDPTAPAHSGSAPTGGEPTATEPTAPRGPRGKAATVGTGSDTVETAPDSEPPAEVAAAGDDGDDEVEPAVLDADEDEDEVDDEVEPYDLPRILAIANQKGGVGKTTTSVNLGAALAEMGYRVLVVDLDPQGNATTGLGVNARELEGSVYDVIMNDAPVEDCVEPTSLKNLFVVPATIDLAGAEIELVPAFSRELKLRRALHEMRDDYDYMIIDCPPSLGLLTVNGLAAADDVVVPIQCEYYALEGLSQLIRNVSLVQKNLNPSLSVRGIVLTMYDARTKLADQVEQEVRNHFGRTVYQTVVPRTVRLSEAPSFGQPIILFDPTSRGAVAYRELAKEVSSGATRRTG